VVFLEAIPKNLSGKILRKWLRERAKEEVKKEGDDGGFKAIAEFSVYICLTYRVAK
jgi:hypothetical protein